MEAKADTTAASLQQGLFGTPQAKKQTPSLDHSGGLEQSDFAGMKKTLSQWQTLLPWPYLFDVNAKTPAMREAKQEAIATMAPIGIPVAVWALKPWSATPIASECDRLRWAGQMGSDQRFNHLGAGLASVMGAQPQTDMADRPCCARRLGERLGLQKRLTVDPGAVVFAMVSNNKAIKLGIARHSGRRKRDTAMGVIVWIIVGGIIGWLASIVMGRNRQQGLILNVIVGIVGAMISGWLLGGGINQSLSLASAVRSLVGAVILLGLVNFFTRGKLR